MSDALLRCSLCGHEEERPWTQVVLGERCPRCATGRLIPVDPRTSRRAAVERAIERDKNGTADEAIRRAKDRDLRIGEGVRPRNTRP